MADYQYDMLVLGAGPAGESAALNAAKHKLKTAVIDDRPRVGGACTHKGTIPSKALRSGVQTLMRYNQNPLIRGLGGSLQVSYPQLLSKVNEIISQQVDMRASFYSRNQIEVLTGQARFSAPHTVQVEYEQGAVESLSAKNIVIATGSRPHQPADIDFSHPRIYDSDSILQMQHTPRRIIIYGAGVIGCEYASIFAGLRVKVDLINNRQRLLEFLDDEITDALSYHLRKQGVMIRHQEEFDRVEAGDDGISLYLKSGKRLHGDALLWCNGRSGNTDQLNLSAVGLQSDQRGNLAVNQHYQTDTDNIYAVGDVIGWPSLASAAYIQGRAAAASARGKEHCIYVEDVTTGIYTIPEISSVGHTERELTAACIPYEVGRAFFKDTAKGQISGEMSGMLKILCHSDSLEILGIHCFGHAASEIIHIGQAIMKQALPANDIRYFVNTTFNYPTMAEAYRTAALNGLNRLSN